MKVRGHRAELAIALSLVVAILAVARAVDARAERRAPLPAPTAAAEAAFRAEPPLGDHIPASEAAVRQALREAGLPEGSIRGVECRARTCRVELLEGGAADVSRALPIFLHAGPGAPDAIAGRTQAPDGTTISVLYLGPQAQDALGRRPPQP